MPPQSPSDLPLDNAANSNATTRLSASPAETESLSLLILLNDTLVLFPGYNPEAAEKRQILGYWQELVSQYGIERFTLGLRAACKSAKFFPKLGEITECIPPAILPSAPRYDKRESAPAAWKQSSEGRLLRQAFAWFSGATKFPDGSVVPPMPDWFRDADWPEVQKQQRLWPGDPLEAICRRHQLPPELRILDAKKQVRMRCAICRQRFRCDRHSLEQQAGCCRPCLERQAARPPAQHDGKLAATGDE